VGGDPVQPACHGSYPGYPGGKVSGEIHAALRGVCSSSRRDVAPSGLVLVAIVHDRPAPGMTFHARGSPELPGRVQQTGVLPEEAQAGASKFNLRALATRLMTHTDAFAPGSVHRPTHCCFVLTRDSKRRHNSR